MLKLVIACYAISIILCIPTPNAVDSEASKLAPVSLENRGSGGGKKAFKAGSDLKIIAEESAQLGNHDIANKHTEASEADVAAQSNLARAACNNAARVQADLFGKQIFVQKLEHDVKEARQNLQAQLKQFQQAQLSAFVAQDAVQQAQQQINALSAAMNTAQGGLSRAQQAAEEANAELCSQQIMVSAAKQRFSTLNDELRIAQCDLSDSQAAAQDAEDAADIAESNAVSPAESAQDASANREAT